MGSTSSFDLLKRVSQKIVPLPAATAAAREAGELAGDEELVVRIRTVTAKEMVVAAGAVPNLYALVREKREDETPEEFALRMQQRALEDPELIVDTNRQDLLNQRALIALGVTATGIRKADGTLVLDEVELSVGGDLTPEEIFGGDLEVVQAAILAFSQGGRRVGGADRTEAFPGQPAGDQSQPGGEGDGSQPE